MAKYKLYQHADFRSSRCTWLIEELGIEDQFELIDFNPYKATEQELENYQQHVHPLGLVPALVTPEGTVIVESGAICMYFAEKCDKLVPPLEEKHVYYSWIMFAIATADTHLKEMVMSSDKQRYHVHMTRLKGFLGALDHHLKDREYICTSGLSAADIVVAYPLYWMTELKGEAAAWFDKFPENVQAYFDRLKKRPGAQKWLVD